MHLQNNNTAASPQRMELGALAPLLSLVGTVEYGRQRTRHSLGLHAAQIENSQQSLQRQQMWDSKQIF